MRVWLPPLHGRLHLDQPDQSESWQFTGVFVVVRLTLVVVWDVVVLRHFGIDSKTCRGHETLEDVVVKGTSTARTLSFKQPGRRFARC